MSDVKILNGSLEDDKVLGQVIIRGVVDQATLKFIHMGWYQRERGFSTAHINKIISALFLAKKIADITIGMRGHKWQSSKDDTYTLNDKCFCIDGGQRLYATAMALKERPDLKISLGAKVLLGTTEEFENELFCQLGTTQVKISPSVLLRNFKKRSAAAALLVELNKAPEFALKDRIAWGQVKTRHELMSGYTFARIIGVLHAHKGGGLHNNEVDRLVSGLDTLLNNVGAEVLETNIIRFFDAIDKCWTIRQITGGREPRPHLKPLFLLTIARLFSAYSDFWDGKERNEFYIAERHVKKLKGLKLAEYLVQTVVPREVLYELIRKRLNLDPVFEETQQAAE